MSSSSTNTSFFDLLDEDSLRSILLRTSASDHHNLRQTCRRVNRILNSREYRKMRSELGYAEIKVKLLPPFEQYKKAYSWEQRPLSPEDDEFLEEYDDLGCIGEYGDHELHSSVFTVFVDGVPLSKEESKIQLHLLPRCVPFFEMCDSISEALQRLSVRLFANNGNPRVKSLKDAISSSSSPGSKRELLYISEFELPEEYRSVDSTVGPKIVRSMLTETLLKNRWDLAIYIPHFLSQIAGEEAGRYHSRDPMYGVFGLTEEQEIEKEQEQQRYDELTLQDMRQFFRAGFRQVNDKSVVENCGCYYVYATPADIQNNKPIATASQALAMDAATFAPVPPKKRGHEKELLELVIGKCSQYSYMEKSVKKYRRPIREQPEVMDMEQQIRSMQETLQQQEERMVSQLQTAFWSVQEREALSEQLTSLREKMEEFNSGREQLMRQLLVSNLEILTKEEEKLNSFCSDARSEMSEILEISSDKDPRDVIVGSDALHACAANKTMPFIEMLLGFISDEGKKIEALNHVDVNGMTPLMVAAQKAPGSNLETGEFRSFCVQLLNLGADKNVVQANTGLSSLGCFRQGMKDVKAFEITMGLPHNPMLQERYLARDEEVAKMESLLKPTNGETEADQGVLNDRLNEEEGGFEDENEDDDEYDDEFGGYDDDL